MKYQQKHGVNIGRWLCHGDDPLEERAQWLKQEDLHKVRDIGLDHVRLCMKEIYFWDEAGNLNQRAFDILRQGIDWALDAGLVANVNLHILRSHFFMNTEEPVLFTDPAAQQRFVHFWEDVSDQLHDYPNDKLAYEFLNEPVARANERWNNVWRPAYDALRAKESERTLILGSNLWNQTRTFADLAVPENDPNMILDFHFYEPLLISHYNAEYVKMVNVPWKVKYPGQPLNMPSWMFGLYTNLRSGLSKIHRRDSWHENDYFDRSSIVDRFQKAIVVAKKYNLPLNLGEFGLYYKAIKEAAYPWLHDVFSVCEEFDISWTIWCLGKGNDGFAIVDENGNPNEIVSVMKDFL